MSDKREQLISIFKGENPAKSFTPITRRAVGVALGLELQKLMIASPAKAEEHADIVLGSLDKVSQANKDELLAKVPFLDFLFDTPAAAAAPAGGAAAPAADSPATAARARAAGARAKANAPAAGAAAESVVSAGSVGSPEGGHLRLEQMEMRLAKIEESQSALMQRQADILEGQFALLSLHHYLAQVNSVTEQATVAGFLTEAGVKTPGFLGG